MLATLPIALDASKHPVKSVTIFQSSTAEVTRSFPVDLKNGNNVVEISGISSQVDTQSPRIHGLGANARVFDILCRQVASPHTTISKNADEIKRLRSNRKALDTERTICQQEYNLVDTAAQSLVADKPVELEAFVDSVVRRKRDAMKAIMELDEKINKVDDELWTLLQAHKGETAARVTATILAKRDCSVELQLTYLVTGPSWRPHYDLHATTTEGQPSPDVSLLYCAKIMQSTGEDWNDIVLILSTANSQTLKSLSVPKIDPLKVLPLRVIEDTPQARVHARAARVAYPPQARAPAAPVAYALSQPHLQVPPSSAIPRLPETHDAFDLSGTDSAGDDMGFMLMDDDPPAPPASATVDRSPLSLAYRVDGNVTLPSDGVAHKVSIAVLNFSADLKYVCVPRKTTSAFIEGRVKNTSAYELLAGPVSVFMDEGFVTKTSLNLIGVDETFDCVLGVDTALKVAYEQKSRSETEPVRSFSEPTTTTTRVVTTTVTNGHSFDIEELVVRDAIPLGDKDSNIKVMLHKPEGLAQAKDGDEVSVSLGEDTKDALVCWSKVKDGKGGEKEGMYEWACEVAAGKKVKLEAEWAVKAPAHIQWHERSS